MFGVERYQRKMRSLRGCPVAEKLVMVSKIGIASYACTTQKNEPTYCWQQGGFEACKVSQKNPEIKQINSNRGKTRLASFPGLPCVFVLIQYTHVHGSERAVENQWGRPGNEAKTRRAGGVT